MKASSLLGAVCAAFVAAAPAVGQTYPERQISMVVPFSAGGPTDTVARLVAERMSEDLGQQIIVENVGGAGGTLGAAQVAKAEPDGYTLLLHHIGMATSATLYRNLPYDPQTAFDYVGLVTEVPMVVVARKDFEPTDFAGFIEYVKANADKLTLANAGIGSASHLCGMLVMSALEAPLVTVPYKGTGPAMTDLLGGQTDIMFDNMPSAFQHVKAGKLRAIAVTTDKRYPELPDVPTIAEAGVPGYNATSWFGLFTNRKVPADVLAKLNDAMVKILAKPEVIKQMAEQGAVAHPEKPAEFEAFIKAETAKWGPVVKQSGATVD